MQAGANLYARSRAKRENNQTCCSFDLYKTEAEMNTDDFVQGDHQSRPLPRYLYRHFS